jgi:hypothetical protein
MEGKDSRNIYMTRICRPLFTSHTPLSWDRKSWSPCIFACNFPAVQVVEGAVDNKEDPLKGEYTVSNS